MNKNPTLMLQELGMRYDSNKAREKLSRFMEFQDSIFTLLVNEGHYLKGISVWDLEYKEREKVFHFALKVWELMSTFDR